jgi:hypothetical protein
MKLNHRLNPACTGGIKNVGYYQNGGPVIEMKMAQGG